MTVFAKRTMNLADWSKLQRKMEALLLSLGAPHDLMMLSSRSETGDDDDIYIGLPDHALLAGFPGFVEVSRDSLPDHLVTLIAREDRFEELFPDILKKRRSRLG